MIGKMRDMVTAAVVVSAADNKSPKFAGTEDKSSQSAADSSSAATKFGLQPETVADVSALPDASKSSKEQQEEKQEEKNRLSPEFVSEMTKELNELMGKLNCDLEFQYHKEVDVMSVRMIDKNTKEVIKELPPEKTLDMIARVWDMAGILVDEKR